MAPSPTAFFGASDAAFLSLKKKINVNALFPQRNHLKIATPNYLAQQ